MFKHTIHIFPVPLFVTNIKHLIDINEFKPHLEYWQKDDDYSSDRMDELNYSPKLKSVIEEHIDYAFHEIYGVSRDIEIYLTESWKNTKSKNYMMENHYHSNSVLSGVFYYQVTDNTPAIKFTKGRTWSRTFNFKTDTTNMYNTDEMNYSPEPYDLLIFTSDMDHEVGINQSNIPRISIAFNTFVKGEINKSRSFALTI